MPKKARQAHVPQQVRKRKPRRAAGPPATGAEALPTHSVPELEAAAEEPAMPVPVAAVAAPSPAPVARGGRRLELLTNSHEQAGTVRVVPGQLPTFERAYLVNELRRILITAGTLLCVIIFLSLVLR